MSSVDEVKARADIVDVVGETVPLKRSGRNFMANCPFHQERTPSFFVFPDRQGWRCFGACATGGDVLSFVMKRDNMPFIEALKALAERAGIELPDRRRSKERGDRAERLKALHRAAALYFHEMLLKSAEAEPARRYLEERGLSPETVEDFRLGHCPTDKRLLERRMEHEGFSVEEMLAAGLLRRREDGSDYSLFRGRLMIPIQDERSDYLAFGARALGDERPKYVNSPQSEVFEKASTLYGIHRAREAIRSEGLGVIVEGYMDVLTAHQHGFSNVVASMGTALTERQVTTLTRLATSFVLAMDPDAAGDEATLRSLESSWRILDRPRRPPGAPGLTGADPRPTPSLRVMNLPRGKDPDDLIREDPEAWRGLMATATPVIEYVFEAVTARFDIATPQGKDQVTRRLAPLIHHAPNVFEWNARVALLAKMLKEEENIIKQAIGGGPTAGGRRRPKAGRRAAAAPTSHASTRDSLEAYTLASLLRYPELWELADALEPEHFLESDNREIFGAVRRGIATEDLKGHLDEAIEEELDQLLTLSMQTLPHWEREEGLAQCIQRLDRRLVLLELEALQSRYESGEADVGTMSARAEELTARLREMEAGDRASGVV